jgi:glycosyltransferase involved in cell wall biosynthesis
MINISIITPVWNGAKTIKETMDSIYQQGALHEHLILDAMSTDGTAEVVRQCAIGATIHVREKDKGLYDAMNKGIQRATGEVIGIINADDQLMPDALLQVSQIFEDPTVDYVFSEAILMDESERVIGRGLPLQTSAAPPLWPFGFDWRFYTPYTHPTLFVRKRVYEAHGAFDLRYRLAADHDLMARFISKGLTGVQATHPLARFRLGGLSSGTTSIFKENESIAIRHGMPAWLAKLNCWKCILGRTKNNILAKVSGQ